MKTALFEVKEKGKVVHSLAVYRMFWEAACEGSLLLIAKKGIRFVFGLPQRKM